MSEQLYSLRVTVMKGYAVGSEVENINISHEQYEELQQLIASFREQNQDEL